MPNPDLSAMVKRLGQTTYLDLFQRMDEALLDSLWAGGGAFDTLQAIVRDSGTEGRIRFLAAEILFRKSPAYPPPDTIPFLADVYAAALRDAPREMANPWGLPGLIHDAPIAGHVLCLGEAAVPALQPLLDDTTPVHFSGSKEATYGDSFAWRVNDIAASLIARIRELPFAPDRDPSNRDSSIARLKAALEPFR